MPRTPGSIRPIPQISGTLIFDHVRGRKPGVSGLTPSITGSRTGQATGRLSPRVLESQAQGGKEETGKATTR